MFFDPFREFASVSFEFLFAFYAAEIVCFSVVSYLIFRRLFVQNYAADRISRHDFSFTLPLMNPLDKVFACSRRFLNVS